jgi:hypothetical protein
VAVDGGDRGAGQLGQFLVGDLATTDRIVDRATPVEFLELLEVGTGDETGLLGRLDHHALRRVDGDALDQVAQLQQHILGHRIDVGVLAVEIEHDDAIGADFRVPVCKAQPIEA